MRSHLKTAIVSGCTDGIGEAILKKLINQGYNCIGLSRNIEKLFKIQEEYSKERFVFLQHDFRNIDEFEKKIASLQKPKNWKEVSVIINNIGGSQVCGLLDMNYEVAMREFNKTYLSFHCIIRRFYKDLEMTNDGRIINILGTSVLQPFPYLPYASIKSSFWNIAKIMAKEFKKDNIKVNNIHPGPTNTKELANIFEKLKETREDIIEETKKKLISKQFINTSEIAELVLFLCSRNAIKITGQDIIIDDGYLL